ncbi:MAG: SGNH/GDSL hydrolase family protein [Ignavibacteriaceae bacterium]|nr:SGNH/GDSL hydrolase family protein [Ignavibacteriaceae bacterium]
MDRETEKKVINQKENYTIVVYGDSISRGVIYDDEKQKYSLLLESFTNLVRENLKGVVYNAAKFGSTIVDGLQRLSNDVLRRKPDIVLIEFGGNDCDYQWDRIAENPFGEFQPNTECSTFYDLLTGLVKKLDSMKIIPVLVSLPPLDPDKYFRWVSHNSEQAKNNILQFIGSISSIYTWHERYNSAILRVAEETKTRLIDIRSAFFLEDDYTKFICLDGIHPNKEGHKVIAGKILDYIKSNYEFLLNPSVQMPATK